MRRSWLVVALIAGVISGSAAWATAQLTSHGPVRYRAVGGTFTGLRPTAVGLPQVGEKGTVGVAELPTVLRQYHDSGAYGRDLSAVGRAAKAYLDGRIAHRASHGKRLAIVLDIDETSLSNYSSLAASNFSASALVGAAVGGKGTAIQPTLSLYRDARSHNVAVFFITGRPSLIQSITEQNLKSQGYSKGWNGISFKPSGAGVESFKSSTRARLERRGFDIAVNLGDQESDLDGGHADRDFKLPNPFYFIADQ